MILNVCLLSGPYKRKLQMIKKKKSTTEKTAFFWLQAKDQHVIKTNSMR